MYEYILLYSFLLSSLCSLAILFYDLYMYNQSTPELMKLVWILTIAYSGIFGLLVYWISGRKQISIESLYTRAIRSTAHCYSGCGLGEILGITIAVLYFSGTTLSIIIGSFSFAYFFGFLLTIGPLMQDGVSFVSAVKDALYTETGSITVMEIAAVSVDLLIMNGRPQILTDPFFWVALFVSLSIGFIVAYPVNMYLIKNNIKSGMMNPQEYK